MFHNALGVWSHCMYKEEVFEIIGAAIEVRRELGHEFLETIYQEAFEIELERRNIPFKSQRSLRIQYKEQILHKKSVALP